MALAYIGLGTNIGPRESNLAEAIRRLGQVPGSAVTAKSTVLETDPVEYLDQPAFLNQVAAVETDLPPMELLRACQRIESDMGRSRDIPKGPRIIDLDILLYDSVIIKTGNFSIPHPAIRKRDFVMKHLVELDADLADPETGEKYSLIYRKAVFKSNNS